MSDEPRDGKWMDKWGACRVCDGEIPYGHQDHCDLYTMEKQIKKYKAALKEIADTDYRGNRSTESQIADRALNE